MAKYWPQVRRLITRPPVWAIEWDMQRDYLQQLRLINNAFKGPDPELIEPWHGKAKTSLTTE